MGTVALVLDVRLRHVVVCLRSVRDLHCALNAVEFNVLITVLEQTSTTT